MAETSLSGYSSARFPPGRHQLRAEERARALQRGQAHVLDRIGIGIQDDLVNEALDRTAEEIAHSHVELPETVLLAPFLLVLVEVPQSGQLTAERMDGPGAV